MRFHKKHIFIIAIEPIKFKCQSEGSYCNISVLHAALKSNNKIPKINAYYLEKLPDLVTQI